jgi:hypothetical protein
MKKFIILILLLFSIFTVLSLQAKTIQSTIKKFHDAQDLIQYENSPQSQQTKKNVFNLFKWMKLVGTRKKLFNDSRYEKIY